MNFFTIYLTEKHSYGKIIFLFTFPFISEELEAVKVTTKTVSHLCLVLFCFIEIAMAPRVKGISVRRDGFIDLRAGALL